VTSDTRDLSIILAPHQKTKLWKLQAAWTWNKQQWLFQRVFSKSTTTLKLLPDFYKSFTPHSHHPFPLKLCLKNVPQVSHLLVIYYHGEERQVFFTCLRILELLCRRGDKDFLKALSKSYKIVMFWEKWSINNVKK